MGHDTREYASINLELTIHNRARVMRAALERAIADGMTANEWRYLRRTGNYLATDIRMLLDPGVSPEGLSIKYSIVEVWNV